MKKSVTPVAVVFEMNGLLSDTESLYAGALLAEAASLGLHSIDDEVARKTIGMSWEATREYVGTLLPEGLYPDRFMAAWRLGFAQCLAVAGSLGDVREMLADRLA